jgi:lipid-A-disaccharide synthase
MKFVLVAGESSGDTLGEDLILALKKRFPSAEFAGIGGPKMIRAGLVSWFDMAPLSVMGIAQVLPKLPALWRLYRALVQRIIEFSPDAYIGIDAPDFNLRVEKKIKELNSGIKVIHYVSPSVWAWRYDRIYDLKEFTDLILCLLPFEEGLYEKIGHKAVFVGHPLANKIPMTIDSIGARQKLNLPLDVPLIAILPGSRSQEVSKLLPIFLDAFARLKKNKNFERAMGVLPVANAKLWKIIHSRASQIKSLGIVCLKEQAGEALAASDIALVASGTAALEAMLYKKPTVVAYKTDGFSYGILRALVNVPYIALPNLLACWAYDMPPLMPEVIQTDVTSENLEKALLGEWQRKEDSALGSGDLYSPKLNLPKFNLIEAFEKIHRELALNSGEIAAAAIQKLMQP